MKHAITIGLALSATVPVQAQNVVGAADLLRLEAKVPRQHWYPADYYDVRIAAEGQVAEFPRPRDSWLESYRADGQRDYNVAFCADEFVFPGDGDEAIERYGDAALLTSRIRYELDALGYPPGVYRDPLLAYEQALLVEAESRPTGDMWSGDEAEELEAMPDDGHTPSGSDAPASGDDAGEAYADAMDEGRVDLGEPGAVLAEAIEANRRRQAPNLPSVIYEACGGDAAPAPVTIRTIPPGGTVMLVSAFAFKVCTRTQPDPWDRFSCRWNEVEAGKPTLLRGRNVYQVRWPDGTVRRGTREFELNYDDNRPIVVTFNKSGG